MIDLGEIQVRILKSAHPHGEPSSFYLESAIPGKKAEFIPKRNTTKEGEVYWDLILPITEGNITFCENNFFLQRGYLVKLDRKEIRNPFNQAKQKAWFEKDLAAVIDDEAQDEKLQESVKFEEKFSLAIQELKAISLTYWEQYRKAEEYGWPYPIKPADMVHLETELEGYVNMDNVFIATSAEDLQDIHDQDEKMAESIIEKGATF
jgi:hypothetical protein